MRFGTIGLFFILTVWVAGLSFAVETVQKPDIPVYGLFETRFDIEFQRLNPYDSSDIQADGLIEDENGKRFFIPCFYDGSEGWKMRFTPSKPGTYTYRIQVKIQSETKDVQSGTFRAIPNEARGFVRIDERSPRYFSFENGESYFPLGENMGWVQWGGTANLDTWIGYLNECRDSGINWIRIWMCPWGMTELVWMPVGIRYHGRQRFELVNARVIDGIFQEAEKRGIYIQWVINHHGQYSLEHNSVWKDNPYNTANGGFLESPEKFFTDEEAQRVYRDRLRYLAGRWGYSTHLLAWEFWNEVDLTAHYDFPTVKAWHERMAAFLDTIDPYDHLKTTSVAGSTGQIFSIESNDYYQSHAYVPNIIDRIMTTSAKNLGRYPNRPHLFGELSYNWRGPNKDDREGVILHNQLWASVHSADCGTAMTWWWDNWVRPYNLYYHFRALADYVEGIDWASENLLPLEARVTDVPGNQCEFTFAPKIGWGETDRKEFSIRSDGTVEGLDECTSYVHGRAHIKLAPNPDFTIETARETVFGFRIEEVAANGSVCTVKLDGETVVERVFASTQNDSTIGDEGTFTVSVPAGAHRISIRNRGRDWFRVNHYWVEDFAQRPVAYARGSRDRVLIWVHDRPHQFATVSRYGEYGSTQPAAMTLPSLREGEFSVERFDPYTGKITKRPNVRASETGLTIELPSFLKDTAYRIRRIPSSVENAPERN